MSKNDCCNSASDTFPEAVAVKVSVDVTKIVKYVCFAGIVIVGIIFGTKCYQRMIENDIV